MTHEAEARKIVDEHFRTFPNVATMRGAIAAALRKRDELYEAAWAECEARREGGKNHIRQAKRGTGVLQEWQKRVSKARDAHDTLRREAGKDSTKGAG